MLAVQQVEDNVAGQAFVWPSSVTKVSTAGATYENVGPRHAAVAAAIYAPLRRRVLHVSIHSLVLLVLRPALLLVLVLLPLLVLPLLLVAMQWGDVPRRNHCFLSGDTKLEVDFV